MPIERLLVVGIGNALCGDDAVGLVVARIAGARFPDRVELKESFGDGAELIELLNAKRSVVLVDAMLSGAAPGTVRRIDATAASVPVRIFSYSSHSFGVAQAIEMARVLRRLPDHCVIIAVEARKFEFGSPITPDVVSAIPPAVKLVEEEIHRMGLARHDAKP